MVVPFDSTRTVQEIKGAGLAAGLSNYDPGISADISVLVRTAIHKIEW